MFICRFAFDWTASMLWHLWRVATGRPNYAALADTGFTVASFLLVFTAGVVLRWAVLAERDAMVVATTWLMTLTLAKIVGMRRRDQNSSLFCVILASSTIVDLLACGVALVAQDMSLTVSPVYLALELALYLALYLRSIKVFAELPDSVRAAGYGRHGKE